MRGMEAMHIPHKVLTCFSFKSAFFCCDENSLCQKTLTFYFSFTTTSWVKQAQPVKPILLTPTLLRGPCNRRR